MVKPCKLVLNPASENRCKDPLRENRREDCHGRRGYDWSTDDPAEIYVASIGPRKLSQVSNDAIGVA